MDELFIFRHGGIKSLLLAEVRLQGKDWCTQKSQEKFFEIMQEMENVIPNITGENAQGKGVVPMAQAEDRRRKS